MYTISMNFKNATFSDTHRLIFNLLDKTNLKWNDKYVKLLYKVLSSTVHEKRSHIETKNLKLYLLRGMINLIYRMDYILYQMFQIILRIS